MVDKLAKGSTAPLEARTNIVVSFGASVVAETLVYPFDTVKTWMQTQRGVGFANSVATGVRQGGALGLYEGVPFAITRIGISTTALMVIPQALSNSLQTSGASEQVTIALATPAVTFTVNGALVPFETLKTRVQADSTLPPAQRRYAGIAHCARQFIGEYGVAALWTGTMPTVQPYFAITQLYYTNSILTLL